MVGHSDDGSSYGNTGVVSMECNPLPRSDKCHYAHAHRGCRSSSAVRQYSGGVARKGLALSAVIDYGNEDLE